MAFALFDLDNTLINGDSDYQWGRFLARLGIVDGEVYERENQRFYDEYKAGELDIGEFLRFSLKPLADNPRDKLDRLRDQFMAEDIQPIMLPAARKLVERHREAGDMLIIITATNHFVTELIAAEFGVDLLIATTPESIDGQFTGNVAGTPCFQDGKVTRLNDWLAENGRELTDSWFYSDSHNDIPLLNAVDHPVAVDPDEKLRAHATSEGWPIISLRD